MTHTPAPWHYDADHINVIDGEGRTVAQRPIYSSCAGSTEEADMRLIAAAPELLAALQQSAFALQSVVMLTGNNAVAPYLDQALAAIAKAKGA